MITGSVAAPLLIGVALGDLLADGVGTSTSSRS